MSLLNALDRGLRLSLGSSRLLLCLWLLNLLVALPAAVLISGSLQHSFGESLVSESMGQGMNTDWFAEYNAQAGGLEETFTLSSLVGPGPILDNLDGWLSGAIFQIFPGIVGLGVAYALLWCLLLGGVLMHLAHPYGVLRLESFGAACGRYFPRFLCLLPCTGLAYYAVYRLGMKLYGSLQKATREVTEEWVVLAWVLVIALLVGLALAAVRMVSDYAKIALVTEDRVGVLGALWAGCRFVFARPLRSLGLATAYALVAFALMGLYSVLSPAPGESTLLGLLLVFCFGQIYLVLRLILRLALLGSELTLYQAVGLAPR